MGYAIETLRTKPVFWIKVFAPADSDDAIRLLMNIYEKGRRLQENQTLHIVLDLSAITFSEKFSASHFIGIFRELYDKWQNNYQLMMWVVVDTSLSPVIHSLVRTLKVPIHIYEEYDTVIEALERLFGTTEELSDDEWSFLRS